MLYIFYVYTLYDHEFHYPSLASCPVIEKSPPDDPVLVQLARDIAETKWPLTIEQSSATVVLQNIDATAQAQVPNHNAGPPRRRNYRLENEILLNQLLTTVLIINSASKFH